MQAKPYRRVDYSHSSVQLMKIAHDNQLLVNHLTTISKAVCCERTSSRCSAHGQKVAFKQETHVHVPVMGLWLTAVLLLRSG